MPFAHVLAPGDAAFQDPAARQPVAGGGHRLRHAGMPGGKDRDPLPFGQIAQRENLSQGGAGGLFQHQVAPRAQHRLRRVEARNRGQAQADDADIVTRLQHGGDVGEGLDPGDGAVAADGRR